MIQNRYKYFRWTKRTAGITFVYVAVIPTIIGYIGYKTDVSLLCSEFGPLGGSQWGSLLARNLGCVLT
jgi:hypothetical protein